MSPNLLPRAARLTAYTALTGCATVTLTPLVWLVAATLKSKDDLFSYTFLAPHLTTESYRNLFASVPFARYMINSVFVAGSIVMAQLFFSSLAGFALAKYDFRGKKLVMLIMLATMLIPGQVVLGPMYELLYRFRLIDQHLGLIVPGAVSVFGIFLFRQAILQVPDELMHAARIDGCSEFRIYWDVIMPVSRPMIGAFCLISFMGAWNGFLWPQIILHRKDLFTLPIALNQMINQYSQQYGLLMAGTLLSVLPVMVLFLLLQREFVAGLTTGAIKG